MRKIAYNLFLAIIFSGTCYGFTSVYFWRIEALRLSKKDFTEGSLIDYHGAKERASQIGGCYGYSEQFGRYMAWGPEHHICQEIQADNEALDPYDYSWTGR